MQSNNMDNTAKIFATTAKPDCASKNSDEKQVMLKT